MLIGIPVKWPKHRSIYTDLKLLHTNKLDQRYIFWCFEFILEMTSLEKLIVLQNEELSDENNTCSKNNVFKICYYNKYVETNMIFSSKIQ